MIFLQLSLCKILSFSPDFESSGEALCHAFLSEENFYHDGKLYSTPQTSDLICGNIYLLCHILCIEIHFLKMVKLLRIANTGAFCTCGFDAPNPVWQKG